MENVKIHFSMAVDGVTGTVFEVDGKRIGSKLFFDDPEAYRYKIDVHGTSVKIERTGITSMKLLLRTDELTQGTLLTDGFTIPFTVLTHQVTLTNTLLLVKYDMLDEDKIISAHQMLIKWI
jgi:uncharacterized beta-barrel protein YwiB (DUF1934 family)